MNDEAEDCLNVANKARRHGRQLGRQESRRSDWVVYSVSLLAGVGFYLLVEYGVFALLLIPAVLLILAVHYRQQKAKPYFWPTKQGMVETKNERFTDAAYVGFVCLGLGGLMAFPYLIIKTLELRDGGYAWASFSGSALVAVFLFAILRLDHYFLRKNTSNE